MWRGQTPDIWGHFVPGVWSVYGRNGLSSSVSNWCVKPPTERADPGFPHTLGSDLKKAAPGVQVTWITRRRVHMGRAYSPVLTRCSPAVG